MSTSLRVCGYNYKLAGMVVAARLPDISRPAKMTLATLATFADRYGRNIRPSVSRLAEDSGVPRRTMMRHIRAAVDAGYLVAEGYHKEHGKRVAVYRLDTDRINVAAGQRWGGNSSDRVPLVAQGAEPPVAHNQFSEINSDLNMKVEVGMNVYSRVGGLAPHEQAEKAYYSLPSSLMTGPALHDAARQELHDLVDVHGLDSVLAAIEDIRPRAHKYRSVRIEWLKERCEREDKKTKRMKWAERLAAEAGWE